ncbi:MAG: enoyl-CoA hydratase/isomerase family protein [Pseudomonadales bacterium]
MESQEILVEVSDGVALITFNRPEQLNSLSESMLQGLGDAYRRCDEDDNVRVVVVTGAGKAFCAGADLSQGGATFAEREDMTFSSCPLSMQAYEVRKPVIAACNGHAIGVGLGIAVQCDMRILAEEGKYGFLQSRRGVIADFAIHHLLPRMIGLENALQLIMTGQRLTGVEAKEKGLAARVLPTDEVLPAALDMARDIAINCSPLVIGMAKKMIWQGMGQSLADMEQLETRLLHYSMGRPDAIEGGMAFFEKRVPEWKSSVSKDWPDWF